MICIKLLKKFLIILIILVCSFTIIFKIITSLTHKNNCNRFYTGFSKTNESDKLEVSLNNHFNDAFTSASPKKAYTTLNNLFKCQLQISLNIRNSTSDDILKEKLNIYIEQLQKNLKTTKNINDISKNDKNNKIIYNCKLLKTFDINLLKTLIDIQDTYDINMFEDYSNYIQYLIYNYDISPDTYDSFIPTDESFTYFDHKIYPDIVNTKAGKIILEKK